MKIITRSDIFLLGFGNFRQQLFASSAMKINCLSFLRSDWHDDSWFPLKKFYSEVQIFKHSIVYLHSWWCQQLLVKISKTKKKNVTSRYYFHNCYNIYTYSSVKHPGYIFRNSKGVYLRGAYLRSTYCVLEEQCDNNITK